LQIAKPISIGDDDSLTTPSAGLYGKSQRRPQGQTVLTFKLVATAKGGGGFPRASEGEAGIETFSSLHPHNKNFAKKFRSPLRSNV